MRNLELLHHPRLIQRGNPEPAPLESSRPILRPARAEPALSIVKDEVPVRWSRFSVHMSRMVGRGGPIHSKIRTPRLFLRIVHRRVHSGALRRFLHLIELPLLLIE